MVLEAKELKNELKECKATIEKSQEKDKQQGEQEVEKGVEEGYASAGIDTQSSDDDVQFLAEITMPERSIRIPTTTMELRTRKRYLL